MAYSRDILPRELLSGDNLTRALVGIGILLAAPPRNEPNIEDTLISASYEAMEGDDLRIFDLLVSWLSVHSFWINVDRSRSLG